MMNEHGTSLFYVYGWKGSQQYFVTNATDRDEAVQIAKDYLGAYPRMTIEDVRQHRIVWDSEVELKEQR